MRPMSMSGVSFGKVRVGIRSDGYETLFQNLTFERDFVVAAVEQRLLWPVETEQHFEPAPGLL